MTKFFLAMAIGLGSSMALANPFFPWEVTSETYEAANDREEFIALQIKYPHLFGQFDAQGVTFASVHTQNMLFVGPTVCPIKDQRRRYQAVAYGLCELQGDMEGCFQTAPNMPAPIDPCRE